MSSTPVFRTSITTRPLRVLDINPVDYIVRTLVKQATRFWRRLWFREPTLWIELIMWLLITVWSMALLIFGTSPLPANLADIFNRGPYPWLSVFGILFCPVQLAAMVSLNDSARAHVSIANSMWIGALAMSLVFGDYRLPTGVFYLCAMVVALVPYLKFRVGRPI